LTEVVPVAEQMGRRMMHTPFVSTTLAAQAIVMGGTEAQKAEILPQIAEGAAATLALSENNADWDLSNISATAAPDGSDYVLSGKKTFVADLRAAKWIIVSIKLNDSIALAIIPKSSIPDSAIRRETIIDEIKRSYELNLEGITIGAADIMDRAKTEATLKHIHVAANLLGAAELTGSCQSCIDYTVEYLGTRKQFGKLIGAFQALTEGSSRPKMDLIDPNSFAMISKSLRAVWVSRFKLSLGSAYFSR